MVRNRAIILKGKENCIFPTVYSAAYYVRTHGGEWYRDPINEWSYGMEIKMGNDTYTIHKF